MFGQWRFAAAAAGIIVLGSACSSSGTPSAAPGGQSSAPGTGPAATASSPAAGATTPVVSSPGGSGSVPGCKLSASEVSAAIGVTVQDGTPNGVGCTYITADNTSAVSILSTPSSGDEESAISVMGQQYTDIKPIAGESHAYSIESAGEVLYFGNGLEIIVGSTGLDASKALALAKAFAG